MQAKPVQRLPVQCMLCGEGALSSETVRFVNNLVPEK